MGKWTPRNQPGGIYCSPACGGNCTEADYRQAVRCSRNLAHHMGGGWEPRVWENLGWHYVVEKGVAIIAPPGRGSEKYTVFFNTSLQVVTTAETPEEALHLAILQALRNARCTAADCDVFTKKGL